jgi:predicted transcriptional regulator
MVKKEFTITLSKEAFALFQKRDKTKKDYDFRGISMLRQILSNEKARILDTIKSQKPKSIYELSRKLERSFKSVFDDVKLLEKFGFIELAEKKTGKRSRLEPRIIVDSIILNIKI